MTLAPLLPKVDAILVLDVEGSRLAGKYYGDFLKAPEAAAKSSEDLRSDFEKQLQMKVGGIAARADAAEVVTVMGKTAVFCGGANQGGAGGGDVRIVHVGPSTESELVLAHLCEGMYEALAQLMGGSTDRTMVLDNLELVFLLIDEHCDGGIILETDPTKLASAVLLRDDDGAMEDGMQGGGPQTQGLPAGVSGEMGLAQAFMKARDQFFSGAL
eukprot:CAMPEP_0119549332 /NCGR_PEP_ID=MMETSP1352-20130426/3064_1 /TAXON_ID=265584 /ORGANISM="Stauroneis constricta, Strain CCMP1120" /LENGTH=213 /DNA_ID=CAMNT_0007594865 /DNA_START=80 /DNA_END=721 /DNA_ORIENTATION=-